MKKYSKTEKEYLKAIIGTLSLEKLNDREIQEYLQNEKQIDIERSEVTKLRLGIQRSAYKWYNELRKSKFLYIAHFKQRIDTVYKVQKTLWEIANNKNEQTSERRGALAEIHSTEKTLSALYDISRYLTDRIIKDYDGPSTNNEPVHTEGQTEGVRPILSTDSIPPVE